MRDRPHFEQGALTDWLGKHTSAVWRTADGSNVKSRLVLQSSACYYDHGPAAYEVAHIRKHPLSCQYFGCWPSEVVARLVEVRSMGHSGLDLLTLSSSHLTQLGPPLLTHALCRHARAGPARCPVEAIRPPTIPLTGPQQSAKLLLVPPWLVRPFGGRCDRAAGS